MILNHSKTINKIAISLLCLNAKKEIHGRDITVLLRINIVHYSSLFQYFLLIYYLIKIS